MTRFAHIVLVTLSVLAAGEATAQVPGLTCDSGRGAECMFPIAPGIDLVGPPSSFVPDADGLGFTFDDGEQRVELRVCAPPAPSSCIERMRGTMYASVPQLGPFAEIVTVDPPLTTVGLDTGANLIADLDLTQDLVRMIDPAQSYFIYFSQTKGISAQFPGIKYLGLESGGDQTVLMFSKSWALGDALIYFQGKIPGFPFDGKKPKKAKKKGDDDKEESESVPAALAVATGGTAPFEPVYTAGVESLLRPFDGHLYVRAEVPLALSPLVVLAGTVVVDLDPDEDRDHPFEKKFYSSPDLGIGGNGVVDVQLPMVKIKGLDLTLGRASAEAFLTKKDDAVVFSGYATSENFLAELPIPVRPDGEIRTFGYVSAKNPAASYVHGEGHLAIDVARLGEVIGVPLESLVAQSAKLDVSALGVSVQGTTESRLNPNVAWSGGVTAELYVAPKGKTTWVELRGDMKIGGEGLDAATLHIDKKGIGVTGIYKTELYDIPMSGRWDKNGYRLSGSAQLADPLELNAQETARAAADLLSKREVQALIQAELAVAEKLVQSYLGPVSAARRDFDAAQKEVSRLAAVLKAQDKTVATALSNLNKWKNKSCGTFDVVCQAKRAANVTRYAAECSALVTAREATRAAKKVADGVLSAALSILRPLETNLTNAQGLVNLTQAKLDDAIAAVVRAQKYLDSLPPLDGKIVATVTVTLENGVASASIQAKWNGRKITDGYVNLGNPGKACLRIPAPGVPELCSPL